MPSTVLTHCPNCNKPISPTAIKCRCGQLLLRLTLQPKQRRILNLVRKTGSNAATKIGGGGSRGSTKSRTGRDIPLLVALENPGCLIYIVARNLGNLEDNYIKKYRSERPDIMEFYRGSPRPEITLPPSLGGSVIGFRYADNPDDMTRLERGPEAILIVVEQAEQFTEEELIQIAKPARWPGAELNTAKVLYLFNPGGPGSSYLQRVFYLRQYSPNERPEDYAFVQMYGWDNFEWFRAAFPGMSFDDFYALPGDLPACPSGNYDQAWLDSLPDDHRFKMYVTRTSEGQKYWAMPPSTRMGDLFGRFDVFAGQYFGGVWNPAVCVLSRRDIAKAASDWWTAWMGGDWGFGHHGAYFWACIGTLSPSRAETALGIDTDWPLDILIIYRELIPPIRSDEHTVGQMIVDAVPKAERAELRRWVMGSDTNTAPRFAPHTIRQMMEEVTMPAGLPRIRNAQDGRDSRANNARLCYGMLARTTSMRSANPPRDKPDGKTLPLMFISAECPELIKAIPGLSADPDKPDDVLKVDALADDVFDGWKYTCAEYLSVRDLAPAEVRRAEFVGRAETNQGRYMNMLKFDEDEGRPEVRAKRR